MPLGFAQEAFSLNLRYIHSSTYISCNAEFKRGEEHKNHFNQIYFILSPVLKCIYREVINSDIFFRECEVRRIRSTILQGSREPLLVASPSPPPCLLPPPPALGENFKGGLGWDFKLPHSHNAHGGTYNAHEDKQQASSTRT